MPRVTSLKDGYAMIQVSHWLALMVKSTRKKSSIVCLYAGFEDLEKAGKFCQKVVSEWRKDPTFDLSTRPSKRLKTKFEVKVRKPTLEQAHILVNLQPKSNVVQFRKISEQT